MEKKDLISIKVLLDKWECGIDFIKSICNEKKLPVWYIEQESSALIENKNTIETYSCNHFLFLHKNATDEYLSTVYLEREDVQKIEYEYPSLLLSINSKWETIKLQQNPPEEKDALIAALESELTAAQPASEDASPSPKTTAATEARATVELAKWKEQYAPAMVKVALRCGAEGQKKRQSGDFVKLFKDAGVTLSKKKLALFRGWLPDEHTDRDGGAPTQD